MTRVIHLNLIPTFLNLEFEVLSVSGIAGRGPPWLAEVRSLDSSAPPISISITSLGVGPGEQSAVCDGCWQPNDTQDHFCRNLFPFVTFCLTFPSVTRRAAARYWSGPPNQGRRCGPCLQAGLPGLALSFHPNRSRTRRTSPSRCGVNCDSLLYRQAVE